MTNPVAGQPHPIVLLPGLNGDARVFACQTAAFPTAQVVRWQAPLGSEPLADYARRVAASLDLTGPCIVVGVSFGGIVAAELARHLDARCCVIVSSTRTPRKLPAAVRWVRPFTRIMPPAVVRLAFRSGMSVARTGGANVRGRSARQLSFARWALQAMATWEPTGTPPCPVFQIHGDRDAVFPRGAATADRVVAGGGHLLARTHGREVNAFVEDCLRVADSLAAGGRPTA